MAQHAVAAARGVNMTSQTAVQQTRDVWEQWLPACSACGVNRLCVVAYVLAWSTALHVRQLHVQGRLHLDFATGGEPDQRSNQ